METAGQILSSSNGIPIAIICVTAVIILLILGKLGMFSFNSKGLKVGRTESELRAVLLKQKEYLLQYCSYLTQKIMSDMEKIGVKVNYINTNYVIEKVIDQWLGWLLVNHISEDEMYISTKTEQAKYTMLKAIGKVNSALLQDDKLKEYFNNLCVTSTKEIVKGLLNVYRLESK